MVIKEERVLDFMAASVGWRDRGKEGTEENPVTDDP
jgi:hypothetical protein